MKRALLCGSQIEGLRGVTQDVQRMAAHLAQRGFEVQTRTGERATRAGILAGYDELIAASAPGDAAVFFYAGHGGRATLPGEHGRTWRCIAPTDLRAGTDDDWRGITGWELSIKQAQLTARTANATVILDCCHAAMMSRDAAPQHAIPRALPHPLRAGFEAHLSALRATYGADCEDVDVLGSADAVRLVACDEHQTAWESPDAKGDFGGVFTRALLAVLQEVGEVAVSWAALADAVRARVLRSFAHQRPDVEGPLHRQVFSLVEADDRGGYTFLPARHRASGLRLPVGRLTGAHVGDVYGVMPVGSREYDEPRALATVELVEVAALTSRVGRLADAPALPPDAVAIALHKRAERRAVALDAPSWALASLTAALEATSTLRPLAFDEPPLADDEPPLATVRVRASEAAAEGAADTAPDAAPAAAADAAADAALAPAPSATAPPDAQLVIEDARGPLRGPLRFPDQLALAVRQLVSLAVAQALRELEGAEGAEGVEDHELALELGLVDRGHLRPLPPHGAQVGLGDHMALRVQNLAARDLYLHVLDVSVAGDVTLVTKLAPSGVCLPRGGPPFVLGEGEDGRMIGFQFDWPGDVPRGAPRFEELMVVVTAQRASLADLEGPGDAPAPAPAPAPNTAANAASDAVTVTRSARTRLEELVTQLRHGVCRSASPRPGDGFLLRRLSVLLHPGPAAPGRPPS